MSPKVSVLIVNWNGRDLLPDCLAALKAQRSPPQEAIVVDNGSADGSRAFLEGYDWPSLKTLFLDRNTGFSGGNNAGLPLTSGDVIALLNNDAAPAPEWIERALPLFDDPSVGMVACKIVRRRQPDRIDKAGHLMYPDGLNRGRGTGQVDRGQFDRVEETLWPDGCAGFYRRSMLDEIGFFDDDFFLYGEDAELGMRARWAGWRCLYQPESLVYHRHSASLGKFDPKKAYYIERNRMWVLVKTFPLGMILLSPWLTLWRFAWNGASLVSGRGSAAGFRRERSAGALALALAKALWHGLLGAPRMWAKRKTLIRRVDAKQIKQLLRRGRISARAIALED